MKVATQSCTGKKVISKSKQNPQKTPAKEPILWQNHRLEEEPPKGIFLQGFHNQILSY